MLGVPTLLGCFGRVAFIYLNDGKVPGRRFGFPTRIPAIDGIMLGLPFFAAMAILLVLAMASNSYSAEE